MRRTWKKVVALALAATLVTGVMAPAYAAAAETLDEDNAVTLTNEDWYTPAARKAASAGLITGQTSEYDPSNPYVNVNVGLFHNVSIEVDENT